MDCGAHPSRITLLYLILSCLAAIELLPTSAHIYSISPLPQRTQAARKFASSISPNSHLANSDAKQQTTMRTANKPFRPFVFPLANLHHPHIVDIGARRPYLLYYIYHIHLLYIHLTYDARCDHQPVFMFFFNFALICCDYRLSGANSPFVPNRKYIYSSKLVLDCPTDR